MISIQLYLIIIIVIIILTIVRSQNAFNIYKAYDKAVVRPPQYNSNRKRNTRPINEYLSPQQLQMAKIRSSNADEAGDTWTPNTLNGFTQYKQFQAQGRIRSSAASSAASAMEAGQLTGVRRRKLIGTDIEIEIERDVLEQELEHMDFDFQYNNPLVIGLSFICISVLAILGVTVYKTRTSNKEISTISV